MHKCNIVLLGANGQVGFELQRTLSTLGQVTAVTRAVCDLADPDAVRQLLNAKRPDVIVNAAAYTAVDKAESDEKNAVAVNAALPALLADEAESLRALLVHYSSDYVYDGRKATPYIEGDAAQPASVYGRSKLAGDNAVLERCARSIILRTSWVYGNYGQNFLKTMLRLASTRPTLRVVADQFGAPTSAALIADITAHIIRRTLQSSKTDCFGVFHLAATGRTTWHEYASHVVAEAKRMGMPIPIEISSIEGIPATEYPTPATRPANSVLDTSKLQRTFDICLPDWHVGVTASVALIANIQNLKL